MKRHLAVDAPGLLGRAWGTEGTAADCRQAVELIEGMDAEYWLADRAYDTHASLSYGEEHEVIAVIPSKRSPPERMMSISAGAGSGWSPPFCGANVGVGHDTPGMPPRVVPRCRFGVWRSGLVFRDDAIWNQYGDRPLTIGWA